MTITTFWSSFSVPISSFIINDRVEDFLTQQLTRFRGVLIMDVQVDYEKHQGLLFQFKFLPILPMPNRGRFLDPKIDHISWGFNQGYAVCLWQDQGLFFSANFFLSYQCQIEEDFLTTNLTRFCRVLIKDVQVDYENIKDFFFSSNFFLFCQCQFVEDLLNPKIDQISWGFKQGYAGSLNWKLLTFHWIISLVLQMQKKEIFLASQMCIN